MVLLLNGFHLILPPVLNQSPSKIPLHLFQICLVVYFKVRSLTHFFTLFIQPSLALSSPRTQPIITSMSMIPSYTSLSLLQIGTIMKFCRQMRNWHMPPIKFALLAFCGEFTNKTKTKQHTKQRFLYMNILVRFDVRLFNNFNIARTFVFPIILFFYKIQPLLLL